MPRRLTCNDYIAPLITRKRVGTGDLAHAWPALKATALVGLSDVNHIAAVFDDGTISAGWGNPFVRGPKWCAQFPGALFVFAWRSFLGRRRSALGPKPRQPIL